MLNWLYKNLPWCCCGDDDAVIDMILTPSPPESSTSTSSSESADANTLSRMRRNRPLNITPRPQ